MRPADKLRFPCFQYVTPGLETQPLEITPFSYRHFWHEGYDKAKTTLYEALAMGKGKETVAGTGP